MTSKFELRLQRLERQRPGRTQRVIYFDARTDPIPKPGNKVRGVLAVPRQIDDLNEWATWAVDVNQTIATTINPLGDTQ